MPAKLVCVDAVQTTTEIPLTRLPLVVGRSLDADAPIQDCWASRYHCQIDQVDGVLIVRDLGSANGTLLNGNPVNEARVLPGDRISIGISTFRAEYEPALQEQC